VASPPLSRWVIEPQDIEPPARSRFELGHNEFRFVSIFDHDVYVIGADVNGQQVPISLLAPVDNCFEDCFPAWFVHLVRRLVHQNQLRSETLGVGLR